MISDDIKLAFKNLRKRKVRSWLTMLGIFISIATVFVLISLSVGLQNSVKAQFSQLGSDKLFIQPTALLLGGPGAAKDSSNFTTKDVNVIERINGVRRVSYFGIESTKVEYNKKIKFLQVGGIPTDKLEILSETNIYKPES